MFRHKGLAKLTGVVGTVAMALTGFVAFTAPANAVSATDGNGRMSPSINWVQWGDTAGEEVNSQRVTWTTPVPAGNNTWLSTRCEIKPVASDSDSLSSAHALTVYKPGSWYGDGLAQMYYVGGSGYGNDMKIGLANKDDGGKVTFDFSCAAYKIPSSTDPTSTLNASTSLTPFTNIKLQGLVFADAESNNWTYYQQEYIKATPTTVPGITPTWRVLDSQRTAGCTTNSVAEMKDKTVRFRSDGGQCGNSGGTGPSSVMFLQNSESARVTLKGGGKTAVALGSIAATDFGDAPVSYGVASSLLQPQWQGGALGTDVTGTTYSKDSLDPDSSMVGGTIFNLSQAKDSFSTTKPTLASFAEPTPRLGAHEDSEVRSHPTGTDLTDFEKNADWDDKNGDANVTLGAPDINDEDSIDIPAATEAVKVLPTGGQFTQTVRCNGAGTVRGWIDWNKNGKFDPNQFATPSHTTNAEASDQVACTAGSATLTWTVPYDSKRQVGSETKSSYMRIRITNDADAISDPSGLKPDGLTVGSGEVEDYKADVHTPSLTILTSIGGNRIDNNDQFKQSIKDSANNPIGDIPDVPTTGAVSGLQPVTNGPVSVGPGQAFHISADVTGGTSIPGDYTSKATCFDVSETPAHPVTVTAGVVTMPSDYDANVQCTFTKNVATAQSITINTIVNNKNGGTKTGDDFPTTVTNNSGYSQVYQSNDTSGSISKTLPDAGTYQVLPAATGTGYHQVSLVYTDSDSGATLTPSAAGVLVGTHKHVVVTRVIEDEPAKLTLKTVVDNTYGGTAKSADFDFTVIPDGKSMADGVKYTEGAQKTTAAGKYTVTGSDKPGYSQVGDIVYTDDADPTHTPLSGMALQLAIANGKSITGVRTVRSNPADLTVITHVTGGGNAKPADFTVTATHSGGTATVLPDNTQKPVASGTHAITTDMSAQPGYRVTDALTCIVNNSAPVDVVKGHITLLSGENVVCEQTVAPKSNPTLTFETQVLGNGKAKPGDFNFAVTPSGGASATYTQGKAQVPGSTDFTVTGSNKAGYAQVGEIVYYANDDTARAHPMTLGQAQQALRNGRSVTGVRQVKPTSIRIHLDRDYRYGGTSQGDGSKITVNPTGGNPFDLALGEQADIAPGTFSVRQFLNAGYKLSDIKVTANGAPVTLNADGSFAVNLGDEVVVTLKNVDEPGTLQWSRFDKDGKTLLSGSKWRLNGPRGQTLDVEDCTAEVCTGLDKDPTPGKFSVTGLKWGNWTVTETVTPAGHELSKPLSLTLNPAEGKYGLLKTGAFQDGWSADVTPGAKPAPGDGSEPALENGGKPSDKKPGPQLSDTGSDTAVVVMIAFATLALGFVLAAGTSKVLGRREE